MLANVVEVVVLRWVLVLWIVALRVPPIFTLAYKAAILILNTVIAPKSWVAAASSEPAAELRLPTGSDSSHFEHALIAGVELVT